MPELRRNSLRQKLTSADYVLGTFLNIPSPQVVEVLGLAGFDFVIIDREHGTIDLARTEELIRATASTDISPLVRVPACDPISIRQPLDMGAAGVHVPQVASFAAAECAIRSATFGPIGERGLQPFVRAASYRACGTSDYLRTTNRDTLIVIAIEGSAGISELDRILTLDRVDVIFIGPYDLSQSLGVPGEVGHPKVREKILEIVEKARNAGKKTGIYADTVQAAHEWKQLGVWYLAVSLDAHIFLNACTRLVAEFQT
jgi:4-hydroxy-2-oxoheptanedioate aldolase